MLRLAEILLEPRFDPTWAQLRQIGVDEAVGVLPRAITDWRGHAAEPPWELRARSRCSGRRWRTRACGSP